MELRLLRYFLTVAKEQSFTKAARQLHITQLTLPRQLAALETLAEICRAYREKYPLVQIAIHTATADTVYEMITEAAWKWQIKRSDRKSWMTTRI